MIDALKAIVVITTLDKYCFLKQQLSEVSVLKSSYVVGCLISQLQLPTNSVEEYSYVLLIFILLAKDLHSFASYFW